MLPVREYRWKLAKNGEDPIYQASPSSVWRAEQDGVIKTLADELTLSPVLTSILVRRGVDTFEKARAFFRPSLDDLHDPYLFDGMQQAVDRIVHAISTQEKILVYGDYDVDGTNGTALLWTFLKQIGGNAEYYIPDRIKEGYGVSTTGIDRAKARGVTLLVTVDCGITAVKQVDYARQLGIEVIVCDHHEPGDELPEAVAVLNSLKPSCQYPFNALCGCAVALKLVHALAQHHGIRARITDEVENVLASFLDLVALATTADIVPLTDENRILVKLGLDRINSNPRPGIRALIETSGLKPGKITAGQIVFVLAPRINAVGRLGSAMRAVELLTCDSSERALELAKVFEDENRNRRKIDEETFLAAQAIVENYFNMENDSAIVLHHETWHPGVIGIVASRLVERYYRPTIMMTTVEGVAKGSARSVSGFNIYQALKRCEDKLLQFGGHKYAAGLSIALDKVEEFKEAFNHVAKELLTEEMLTPEIKIDAEIKLDELTPKFIRVLHQFAPYGPGNMRPVFIARNVQVAGQPRIVGKGHLRFKVRTDGRVFDAIGFNLGGLMERLQTPHQALDLAFSLDESDFSGEAFPQLKIRDIKLTES